VTADIASITLDGKKALLDVVSENGIEHRMGVGVRHAGDDNSAAFRIPGLVTTNKGTLLGGSVTGNISNRSKTFFTTILQCFSTSIIKLYGLNFRKIHGIVFNDRFEYVYFRWFSALRRIVSCLLNRPYIIKYLINITVI